MHAAAPTPTEGHASAAAAACNGAALTKNQKKKLKKKLKKVPDGGTALAPLEDNSAADSGPPDSSPGVTSRQPMPLDSEAPAGAAVVLGTAAGGAGCAVAGASGVAGARGGELAAAAQAGDGFDGRSAATCCLSALVRRQQSKAQQQGWLLRLPFYTCYYGASPMHCSLALTLRI